MEQDGLKIRIKRGPEGFQQTVTGTGATTAQASTPPAITSPPSAAATPIATVPTAETTDKYITSPMVGTLYRSPAPDAPPYVEVGSVVDEDTVVCIVEAMKVMNEIKAESKASSPK